MQATKIIYIEMELPMFVGMSEMKKLGASYLFVQDTQNNGIKSLQK